MKKYLFIIIAAAATCVLAACSKEIKQNVSEEETVAVVNHIPGWTYISAENEEGSKASVDGVTAKFTWNTGDKIAVFSGDTYYVSQGLASSFNDSRTAEFAFNADIDADRTDFAVFPASLVHNGSSVRPGSASNHTAASLQISLPGTYELAQVQDNLSPAPRIAVNVPGKGLAFKSVCALLRITVKDISKDAETITVAFPGKKVWGDFTLTNFTAGTDGVLLSGSSASGDDTITITDLNLAGFADSLVINIPLPMGTASSQEYEDVVVTAYDVTGIKINAIKTPVKLVASVPTAWAPGRKSTRKVTACLPVFTMSAADWQDPSNIIHAYIDDPNRKLVIFAPGNLQAKLDQLPVVQTSFTVDNFGTASEWRFAEHQYTAVGNSKDAGHTYSYNSLQNPEVGDWIDLFAWMGDDATNTTVIGWGEEYKYGIIYTNSSGPGKYVGNTKPSDNGGVLANLWFDWGHNEISYGPDTYERDTWRTPEKEEFRALMNWRCNGNSGDDYLAMSAVKAKINIDGTNKVCGLIIFPDRFTLPYGITITKCHAAGSTEWADASVTAKCSENEFSLAQWQKLEDAGCAFLPFTNVRTWDSTNKINVTNYPGDAIYWSVTQHASKTAILCLAFNDINEGASVYSASKNGLTVSYQGTRQLGYGVRLVRDVK